MAVDKGEHCRESRRIAGRVVRHPLDWPRALLPPPSLLSLLSSPGRESRFLCGFCVRALWPVSDGTARSLAVSPMGSCALLSFERFGN